MTSTFVSHPGLSGPKAERSVSDIGNNKNFDDSNSSLYDLAKCKGEFAEPSKFFDKQLKAVHSSGWTYPWGTMIQGITTTASKDDPKHHLQRNISGERSNDLISQHGDSVVSSSVFAGNTDSSLPESVFRLPQPSTDVESADTSFRLTVGGRSLRKANQIMFSKFD